MARGERDRCHSKFVELSTKFAVSSVAIFQTQLAPAHTENDTVSHKSTTTEQRRRSQAIRTGGLDPRVLTEPGASTLSTAPHHQPTAQPGWRARDNQRERDFVR
jgi:hypothetical protein